MRGTENMSELRSLKKSTFRYALVQGNKNKQIKKIGNWKISIPIALLNHPYLPSLKIILFFGFF